MLKRQTFKKRPNNHVSQKLKCYNLKTEDFPLFSVKFTFHKLASYTNRLNSRFYLEQVRYGPAKWRFYLFCHWITDFRTVPESPALTTKLRARPDQHKVLSHEQRELIEFHNLQKYVTFALKLLAFSVLFFYVECLFDLHVSYKICFIKSYCLE